MEDLILTDKAQSILDLQKKMSLSFAEKGQEILFDDERTATAAKRSEFNQLRSSINCDLNAIQLKLDELQSKICGNVKTAEQPDGLLTQVEMRYADCL